MTYPLRNLSTGVVVASRVGYAKGFFSRLVGLLGKSLMDQDDGLWIPGCDSVHMMCMRVELDIVFLDAEGVVLKIVNRAKRNRPFFGCRGSKVVVELAVGSGSVISVGDRLELSRP